MKFPKKVMLALLCAAACTFLFAQEKKIQKNTSSTTSKDSDKIESSGKTETSVENEYLNDADGTIITSLANSDEYDNKIVALQYLQNAIDHGNTSDDIVAALDQLAGEGINTQNRKNGRLLNNYPDIRRQACLMLSKVPTEHSKDTLVQIAIAENEPMVIAAAVNSLGVIGINNNDEVVDAIAFANKRNEVLNPTSSLALEVLNALDRLSASTQNKRTITDTAAVIAADYHYVSPVRKRAMEVLKNVKSDPSKKPETTQSTGATTEKSK